MSVTLEKETARGRLVAVGLSSIHVENACELALAQWDTARSACLPVDDTWFKGSSLSGKTMLRHRARQLLLRRPLSRLNEHRNLEWLRDRLFNAPRPLAAGVFMRAGLPRYQFLVTERLPGARTLREYLVDANAAERERVLETVARETARMHSLHFVHRDLYPRNLLVADDVWFIDAWRGGPGFNLRGADNDLACLMLSGADLFSEDEQRLVFDVYFAERRAQDRPVEPGAFLAGVTRNRLRLLNRLVKRPNERRGRALPTMSWSPPVFRP